MHNRSVCSSHVVSMLQCLLTAEFVGSSLASFIVAHWKDPNALFVLLLIVSTLGSCILCVRHKCEKSGPMVYYSWKQWGSSPAWLLHWLPFNRKKRTRVFSFSSNIVGIIAVPELCRVDFRQQLERNETQPNYIISLKASVEYSVFQLLRIFMLQHTHAHSLGNYLRSSTRSICSQFFGTDNDGPTFISFVSQGISIFHQRTRSGHH